jgi:hypothetical protein
MTVSENSRKKFVPYFKNKADEERAIDETSRLISEAYPELLDAGAGVW